MQTKECRAPLDGLSETGGMPSILHEVKKMEVKDGGGGGGGATYIFTVSKRSNTTRLNATQAYVLKLTLFYSLRIMVTSNHCSSLPVVVD